MIGLNHEIPGKRWKLARLLEERFNFQFFFQVLELLCLTRFQGKIWAWQDPRRRLSKRTKDQADLIRIG
ncbi:MAG TPA: hypothetical protein VE860_11585, partial [Chthoniobacterales bacterium]|nr:hypothetical protein [Chthoniobacterales bacterium]